MKHFDVILSLLIIIITLLLCLQSVQHKAYTQGYADAWQEKYTKPIQGSGCNYGDLFYDCERYWILTNNVTYPTRI